LEVSLLLQITKSSVTFNN